jgi:hypothetical protein
MAPENTISPAQRSWQRRQASATTSPPMDWPPRKVLAAGSRPPTRCSTTPTNVYRSSTCQRKESVCGMLHWRQPACRGVVQHNCYVIECSCPSAASCSAASARQMQRSPAICAVAVTWPAGCSQMLQWLLHYYAQQFLQALLHTRTPTRNV